jgi:hypothetical protein
MGLQKINWTQIDTPNVPTGYTVDIGKINGPINAIYSNNIYLSGISISDLYLNDGLFNNGILTLTSNSGNTIIVSGFTISGDYLLLSGGTINGDLTVTGKTNLNFLISNSLSATTISGGTFYGDGSNLKNIVISVSVGTGLSGNTTTGNVVLINTAPDQIVTITGGTNIQIEGSYPNFGVNFTGTTGISGDYLPLSGGTVSGSTNFTGGLLSNTISATTISGGTFIGDGSGLTNVQNIYNADGFLFTNRILDLSGNTLSLKLGSNINDSFLNGIDSSGNTIFEIRGTYSTVETPISPSIYFGLNSGKNAIATLANTAFGSNALSAVTTGFRNTAIGDRALMSLIDGKFNVAIGEFVAPSFTGGTGTTGDDNIFIGNGAALDKTTGRDNVIIGTNAYQNNITGDFNTILGKNAGIFNETGNRNTFIGYEAGRRNFNGVGNVFIGHHAGRLEELGNNLLYIENSNSLTPLIWGDFANDYLRFNAKVGINVLNSTHDLYVNGTSRFGNTVQLDTVNLNTADTKILTLSSGSIIQYRNFSDFNVGSYLPLSGGTVSGTTNFTGGLTANTISATTISADTFYGDGSNLTNVQNIYNTNGFLFTNRTLDLSGKTLTIRQGSTGVTETLLNFTDSLNRDLFQIRGQYFLDTNTFDPYTGDSASIYIGLNAGLLATGVTLNTVIGSNALRSLVSGGNGQVAIGSDALRGLTGGCCNVAVGDMAGGSLRSGGDNIFIGQRSGRLFTGGTANILIGANVVDQSLSGNNNVMIGKTAGNRVTGDNNVMIGREAGGGGTARTSTGNVFLGYQAGLSETGSNLLYIENSNSSTPLIYGDFANDLLRFNAKVGVNVLPSTFDFDVNGTSRFNGNTTFGSTINGFNLANSYLAFRGTGTSGYGLAFIPFNTINTPNQNISAVSIMDSTFGLIGYTSGTNTFNNLGITPIINTPGGTNLVRGIFFAPVISGLTGTTIIGFQNTVGSNLFNSISGNTGIGLSGTPTNKLHVSATTDPVRFEGLQTVSSDTFLVTANANGVLSELGGNVANRIPYFNSSNAITTSSEFTFNGTYLRLPAGLSGVDFGSGRSGIYNPGSPSGLIFENALSQTGIPDITKGFTFRNKTNNNSLILDFESTTLPRARVYGQLEITNTGSQMQKGYWGTSGIFFRVLSATAVDTTSNGGSVGELVANSFATPTFSATTGGAYSAISNVYIEGAPSVSSNMSGQTFALRVANGTTSLNGQLLVNNSVGVRVSSPTNNLHVSGSTDPVRFEGLQSGNTDTRILTSDSNGVIRYRNLDSITGINTYTTTGITVSSQTLTTSISYYGVSYSGNVNLTLPSPINNDGASIIIKDEGGYSGTYRIRLIPPTGTIDGGSYADMNINYISLTLIARNNNWWII